MRNDDLLPEIEAAPYIGKHPQTLRKQRRDGALPFPYLKVGGRFFYRQSHLDEYLARCEVNPERRSA